MCRVDKGQVSQRNTIIYSLHQRLSSLYQGLINSVRLSSLDLQIFIFHYLVINYKIFILSLCLFQFKQQQQQQQLQLKHKSNELKAGAPVIYQQHPHDHPPTFLHPLEINSYLPVVETETCYTTTTTFSDKRLQLAYELKSYNKNSFNNCAISDKEQQQQQEEQQHQKFYGDTTINLRTNTYPTKKQPRYATNSLYDRYWPHEETYTPLDLEEELFRRRLLKFAEKDFSLYGTFNGHRHRRSLITSATTMDRDYYGIGDQCGKPAEEQADESVQLLHQLLIVAKERTREPHQQLTNCPQQQQQLQRNGTATITYPPYYLNQQHPKNLNEFGRPLAPLANIDQEQEFEPRYRQQQQQRDEVLLRKDWRKSETDAVLVEHTVGAAPVPVSGMAHLGHADGNSTNSETAEPIKFYRFGYYTQVCGELLKGSCALNSPLNLCECPIGEISDLLT